MAAGPRVFLLLLLLVGSTPLATLGAAAQPETDASRVARALDFIAARQRGDGQWDLSSQGYPAEAAAAAGLDPARWPTPERSAFLALQPSPPGSGMPDDQKDRVYKSVLRIAHAAGAAGYDPASVNGRDLVQLVRDGFVGGQAGDPRYVNDDAFAILALRAAGVPASDPDVRASVATLLRARGRDGGWSHLSVNTGQGDMDSTGMVLAALRAAGEDLSGLADARSFVDAHRDAAEGGYRNLATGGNANCQSTAWALHARHALGLPEDAGALEFLRRIQTAEGGFRRTAAARDTLPDLFCTVEATLVLAGGRFPLPVHAPPTGRPTAPRALEPAKLHLPGPYTRFSWEWADPTVIAEGDGTFTFPRAGVYAYDVLAEGHGVRHREHGTLAVLSARPRIDAHLDGLDIPRRVAVHLDASASVDPDGRVARLVVDWGDGNFTEGADLHAAHAYDLPGERTVRAHVVDEEGLRSGIFSATVHVRNRAPLLPALPPRIVADRAHPVVLPWNATDPDGDALRLTWKTGGREGATADATFPILGDHAVTLAAEDPYGASVEGTLVVEVVNLPPSLEVLRLPERPKEGETFPFSVEARDADGPAPAVRWSFGPRVHDGAAGNISLPAGAHSVTVTATDADGAERHLTTTLVVGADAPVLRLQVLDLAATLSAGTLRVTFSPLPPGTRALVSWESPAGNGTREATDGTMEVPLDATEASVRVDVRHGDATASAEIGPVRRAEPPALAAPRMSPLGPVREGEAVALVGEPVEGVVSYRFDLGDGDVTAWLDEPRATHAWPVAGTYDVRLTARADDGRTATASLAVLVLPTLRSAAPAPTPVPTPTHSVDPAPAEASRAPPVAASQDVIPAARPADDPASRHETPGPGLLPVLLAAALLLRRGRRAA